MYAVLLAILFLLVVAALPRWPYSARWTYYPATGLGLLMLVVLILLLFGVVR